MSTSTYSPTRSPWIFSPAIDLATFLGSAVLALGLLLLGLPLGLVDQDAPEWLWVSAVLLIDVAHVYATGFRVYFDKAELARRPWLYGLTPALAWGCGWALYSESPTVFWRLLAYLAVFHFVRQQYGWIALYRARAMERDRLGWWIDASAIYLATLYPLIYWHAHLPRQFWWFLPGDFTQVPGIVVTIVMPLYWLSLGAYAARSLYRGFVHDWWSPGKDIVLATTAVCWYVGIITFNSDYAFTVTNVITHGIPYMVLVFWYQQKQLAEYQGRAPGKRIPSLATFLGVIWILAFVEEMLWDCGVWHERSWLFGASWQLDGGHALFVSMLAVPQITHYVLDGFIWRRKGNRGFARMVRSSDS